jgi:DNA-3-methyladenine glycosylase I
MTDIARQRYDTAVSKIHSEPRCPWCLGSEAYIAYHDCEWGTPMHDARILFELLIVECAQP